MSEFSGIGRFLILLGILIAGIGLLLTLGVSLRWLGRLPGDIYIKRDNITFYFPLTTSVVVSLVLSLIIYLFRR